MLEYPPVGFHFLVSFVDSRFKSDTRFQSVSGLDVNMETESYREGGENRFEHTLPVCAKYANLTLKRGLFVSSALIDWCMDTFNNMQVTPTDLIISLLNEEHAPLLTWNVVNAFPLKWSVSELNAEQSQLAIESIELKYQYFKLIKPN